jgi:hypothetical protein
VSDDFLSRHREEPRPEFAEGLRRRLAEIEAAEPRAARRRPWRLRPAFAGACGAALAVAALTLPPVRAAAREFLDLFRVQRFAAVPVDLERLETLKTSGIDFKTFVGDQVEVLDPAQEPEVVESVELASALAGVDARLPQDPPKDAHLAEIAVLRPGAFRLRIDTAKLEEVAALLGVEDARVPASWDGATIEVHAPPAVAVRYERTGDPFILVQSTGPEVALPEGVDLAELGALALQMAGMSAEEARLFAGRIDWRSTLLVPIPAQGGNFREVDVNGRKGLLVSGRQPDTTDADGTTRRGQWHSVLLWADEDRVYAAAGPGHGFEVLDMAQSIGSAG